MKESKMKSTKHEARNPKQIKNVLNFENLNLDMSQRSFARFCAVVSYFEFVVLLASRPARSRISDLQS